MGLRERQREAAVRLILDAAAEVFADRGYRGSSMEDVARACDCAPATLYGYFKGKQELFARMVGDRVAEYIAGVGAALESTTTFGAGYDAYLANFLSWGERNRDFMRLLITVIHDPQGGGHPDPEAGQAFNDAYMAAVSGLMTRGLEENVLRAGRAEVLAASLIGLLHANVWRWLLNDDPDEELRGLVDFAARLFLEGAALPETP